MQKHAILLATFAAMAFALAPVAALADGTPAAPGTPPTPPPGGYPDAYRLMYVTEEGFNADQKDISWYNTKVNEIANNLNGESGSVLASLGAQWNIIGSTETVSARANTKTYVVGDGGLYDANFDVPIYNLSGALLASNNADLWDGSLATPGYDTDGIWDAQGFETGEEPNPLTPVNGNIFQSVWTGTESNGDIDAAGQYLGTDVIGAAWPPQQPLPDGPQVMAARGERIFSTDWIRWGQGINKTQPRGGEWDIAMPRLYGLSDPIRATAPPGGANGVPEPAALALTALGLLSLGFAGWRRPRRHR